MAEGRGNGAGAVILLEEDAAKALVRQGQEAGFLTQEEIALALDELDLETGQIEEFYQALEELHIEVLEFARAEAPELDLEPESHDVSTDALQLFLKDIGRVALLTAAQEVELSKRIERGDHRAKQRMVEGDLRPVGSIGKKFRNPGLPFLDLHQGGAFGPRRGPQEVRHRKGFKF